MKFKRGVWLEYASLDERNLSNFSSLLEYQTPLIAKMPKRCVAFGCGNTNRDGVSLFGFPKNSEFRQKWADQVKKTRGRWEGPTAYSHLCSCHFEQDCFEVTGLLSESFGLGKKFPKLKPDAVPTLFVRLLKREAEPVDMVDQPQPKIGRSICDKRKRLMVRQSAALFLLFLFYCQRGEVEET